MQFRRGAEEAQKAAKTTSSFARTHFLSLKDGERALVRFITDAPDWLVVAQHSMVPTRPAPQGYQGQWPQVNTAVCRRDVAFIGMYADCYVCDHVTIKGKASKPSQRQWALAVLREEVMEGGRVVGYRDQVRKIAEMKDGQPTGNEVEEKAIVVLNYGYKNFFSVLDGYHSIYGTVLDRDYIVKRSGAELDTMYSIIPLDPITMSDGRRFDLRESDMLARYQPIPNLEEIVSERASDNYFARFFDVRMPQPGTVTGKGHIDSEGSVGQPQTPAPSNDVDADQLAALAQRVKGYGSGAAAPTSPQSAPQGMIDYN